MKTFTSINENQESMPAKVDIAALPEFDELVKKYDLKIISSDLQKERGVVKFEKPSEAPSAEGKRMYVLYPNGTIRSEYPKGPWALDANGRYPNGQKQANNQNIIDQLGPIQTEDDARNMIARVDMLLSRSSVKDKNLKAKAEAKNREKELFKNMEDEIVLAIYHRDLSAPDHILFLKIANELPDLDQESVADLSAKFFNTVYRKLKF